MLHTLLDLISVLLAGWRAIQKVNPQKTEEQYSNKSLIYN